MPKSPAQTAGIILSPTAASPVPDHEDSAWAAWQQHVDAGRIGSAPMRTFDQRVRLMRNEVTLFGRVVTRELDTRKNLSHLRP